MQPKLSLNVIVAVCAQPCVKPIAQLLVQADVTHIVLRPARICVDSLLVRKFVQIPAETIVLVVAKVHVPVPLRVLAVNVLTDVQDLALVDVAMLVPQPVNRHVRVVVAKHVQEVAKIPAQEGVQQHAKVAVHPLVVVHVKKVVGVHVEQVVSIMECLAK